MSEARAYEPTVTRVKTVTMIPPRLQAMLGMPTFAVRPKRVAAYARVSTNSEEQLTSYEAQVKHYTEHIKSKEHTDNWQFVDVYTDATVIIGLKQNPTIGRRFSPIFSFFEHLSGKYGRCYT